MTDFCCHLNIMHEDTIATNQKINVWIKYFKELESLSKTVSIDPITEFVPLSRDTALMILLTGRDLFLSFHDGNNMVNYVQAEDIISLRTEKIHALYSYIKDYDEKGCMPKEPSHNLKLWGDYIPKIKLEESIINRLPKGLLLQKDLAQPYFIIIQGNPNSQYKILYDLANNVVDPYVNNEKISLQILKNKSPYDFIVCDIVQQIRNGEDLHKSHINNIINNKIHQKGEWER